MTTDIYQNTKIIGLTGSISCGKSTVAKFFNNMGIPSVDADQVSRLVVEPGTYGFQKIIETFGQQYLSSDGSLDRSKLGQFVFQNHEALATLNKIMSPLIKIESEKQFQILSENNKIVIWDAALIIESGNAEQFRPLVVVTCPAEMQLTRLMARNKLTEVDARNRISKQLSSEEKVKHADYIIDSSGTLEQTKQQVVEIYNKITSGIVK